MLKGLVFLLGFLVLGEALGRGLSLPLPGSVLGMLLLAVALQAGVLTVEQVKPASDVLLENMGVFFVPAGVGVMLHADLLRREWPAATLAPLLSTLLVMAVVGVAQQRAERP